jgi:hypothetical protein
MAIAPNSPVRLNSPIKTKGIVTATQAAPHHMIPLAGPKGMVSREESQPRPAENPRSPTPKTTRTYEVVQPIAKAKGDEASTKPIPERNEKTVFAPKLSLNSRCGSYWGSPKTFLP